MTGKKTLTLPAVHASSLLFICALMPALLFKGPNLEFFAITQIVLVMWLGTIVLRSYDTGLHIPRSSLTLSLTLFWLWLALSLFWSTAAAVSVVNFWWIGSLALVFWLYTLTPDRDAVWRHAAMILLVLGLVAALMAVYQVQIYGEQARSVFETRNTHAAFLNIIVLPASAHLLLLAGRREIPRYQVVILGVVIYFLLLSIFMAASRGATLSLIIGMVLLLMLTRSHVHHKGMILLLLLIGGAFLSTRIMSGTGGISGELAERLPHLVQDTGRRVIWESSWNLLQDSPWYGIGLGLFYLAFPPYRSPTDNSGGFFAHNDYLQIWIEAGWPGLLLLLFLLISVLWLFVRAMRKRNLNKNTRVELAGLFCGLLAVAGHSFVDFNLYILSIMMVAGLVMGRFHSLLAGELRIPSWRIFPSQIVGSRAFPVIMLLLLLLPISYFIALGAANSYYDRAMLLAQQGKLELADKGLGVAQRLTPGDDRILIAHADLFRHAATLLPTEADDKGRQSLYRDAIGFLDRAEQANPLRGLTFVVRGRIYEQLSDLAGENSSALAAEAYRRALLLSPRLFQARVDFANLLLKKGNRGEALALLEEGAKYEYHPIPQMIPFYSLTASLRREAGRSEDALVFENRARELEGEVKAGYSLRGY